MKIAVVGAGAMGSLFGALLSEAGAEVNLIDIWEEHVNTINHSGLKVEREGQTRTVNTKATRDPATIGMVDLVVIFVKSTHTPEAAATAASLIGSTGSVMTLQNGMGNADIIAESIDSSRILVGTTSHGATMLGPGSIRHAGMGATIIGAWSQEGADRAALVAGYMTKAGIETQAVAEVREVVWGKLIVNIGINAITALTGIKNGQLVDQACTRELSRAAVEEAVAVAQTQGIKIRDDAVDHVFAVAEATAPNRSSMGQDVDKKRRTEINAINGFIVRTAEKLGVEVPVNKTLAALIETMQYHYDIS